MRLPALGQPLLQKTASVAGIARILLHVGIELELVDRNRQDAFLYWQELYYKSRIKSYFFVCYTIYIMLNMNCEIIPAPF